MDRFFDYPLSLRQSFAAVDVRFGDFEVARVSSGCQRRYADFSSVKVVLWDVYGTICGVGVGDLEQSLGNQGRLSQAAGFLAEEYGITGTLSKVEPGKKAGVVLAELYHRYIDESHSQSRTRGVEYPEVVIERIWLRILRDCRQWGYKRSFDEPELHTAYRWAYFFDSAMQHTYLLPGAAGTLRALAEKELVQGIISNAQFYTPLHLRRLLRKAEGRDEFELAEFFSEQLTILSYEMGCSKPNPAGFEHVKVILSSLGIGPDRILYVGNDMLNDIWAAKQHGMRTALWAVDGGSVVWRDDDERCNDSPPDAVITEAGQLVEMIASG